MRTVRLAAAAAVFAAVMASPGIANAAAIVRPFHADSGDACHYGVADGTLGWQFGAMPGRLTGVDVAGKLTDHPTPAEPVTNCRDDGYASTVTFVAYAGNLVVDSQKRTANNAIVPFSFTLGANIPVTSTISRVVIQVCRGPVVTLPPTYCGTAVTYTPPPVA